MAGFVSIVGAGPWDPGLVTVRALDRLRRADVVIVDYLANPALLLHCRPCVIVLQRTAGPRGQRVPEPSGASAWTPEQDDVNRMLVEHARAGRRVVRLKGGDPCMFGRGGEEAEALHAAGIDFELVPGVSSPIAAPESAGIPVTHRHHTPAVTFVSGWEAYEKSGLQVAWTHLARSAGTIVLMMSVRNARENAARLVDAGRSADTPAAVVRWGTRGIQQTVVGTLRDIADRIEAEGVRPPAVMVVGDVVKRRDAVMFMEKRPLFGRRIAVTRAFVDSARLASSLQDLGADVVSVPALAVVPPEHPEALDAAIAGLPGGYDGVTVSSGHGVDALVEALHRTGRDVRALAGVTLMAVGKATAHACRRRGLEPDILAASPRTEGMIDALADRGLLGLRWLHVRADEGRAALGDAIEDAGGRYTLAIGYRTIAPTLPTMLVRSMLPPGEGGEGLDAVAFGSGKAARHFLGMLTEASSEEVARGVLGGAKIVAIGPVTAEAIERLGFSVAAVASAPSDDAVVEALVAAL